MSRKVNSFNLFNSLYVSWESACDASSASVTPNIEAPPGMIDLSPADEVPEEVVWNQRLKESPACRRKFRIWEETHGCCIYCGKGIPAPDFINGVDSDIEHILPQALGGKSVLDNLICSCRDCNRAKGDLTAIDYMLTQSPEVFSRYMMRLRLLANAGMINAHKYRLLTVTKKLITDDLIDW